MFFFHFYHEALDCNKRVDSKSYSYRSTFNNWTPLSINQKGCIPFAWKCKIAHCKHIRKYFGSKYYHNSFFQISYLSSNPECISHSTNILGNGMNPTFLSPAMSKQESKLDALTLVWQLTKKENSEFKPSTHQAYKWGTRLFLGGSCHWAIAQMRLVVPKMPWALWAFPLKRGTSGARRWT